MSVSISPKLRKSNKKSSKLNIKVSIVRHSFGIDIGKKEFYACYRVLTDDNRTIIKGSKKFDNTGAGINKFYKWAQNKLKNSEKPCYYLMEATGVYYEELAYFLEAKSCRV